VNERKWNVREYRLDDVDALRDLFAAVFHQVRPREHFVWKYHDNPVGRGIITVAEVAGRTVGVYALMPTRLRLGNEVVLGAQAVDAMTHPDFRNQGMFIVLVKACMVLAAAKGVEVLYGFPNANAFGPVHRLGWVHADDIPKWVRLLNPSSVASIPRPVRHLASIGLHLLRTGQNAPKGVDVRMERPTEEEWMSVANSGRTDSTCRIERYIDWFKWRFDPASQRRYVWFSAYREGRLKAWAVFGVNEWGQAPLLDMSGTDLKALEAVVSEATHHAKELGLGMLLGFTTEENAARALRSCGYLQHGSLPLIVRSLTSRNLDGKICHHGSWQISSEDADIF
jgi:GNAT superfamily N-acetyltransferase